VLGLSGDSHAATAAACKAIDLEPENWRHALRLAKVSWGEERVQAARRVLALTPGLALAHWLRATVFIARGAFDMALEDLRPGCAAQDAQAEGAAFPAVGLHLLHALVLTARGDLDRAETELNTELTHGRVEGGPERGQVYAAVCVANTWYARGAILLRRRKHEEANAAFVHALAINPGHVPAAAALRGDVLPSASGMEAALGRAIVLARGNRHRDAARAYRDGLAEAPPGHAGWMLPVEPLLAPFAHREIWEDTLALVRTRAT